MEQADGADTRGQRLAADKQESPGCLMVRIWIDADAAPFEVKEIIFRASRRLKLETILVANQSMALPHNAPTVRLVTVREGANMADHYIVEHASRFDIVITADIPLAARLVEQSITAIDPRGEIYDSNNIASRLSIRNFMDDLRGSGTSTRGSRPYDERDKQAFASSFDRSLTRALRNESLHKASNANEETPHDVADDSSPSSSSDNSTGEAR